jgi:GNAT superfamily N-acetyltransferase
MDKNRMTEQPPRFVVSNLAASPAAIAIADSLGAHVAAQFGPRDERPLSVFAYDGQTLVGGLNGVTHWRWLYVRQLWVAPGHRGGGLGAELLARAEEEARARDGVGVYIDTFDADVADFYERRGFARVGAIADFPPGARRTFLARSLSAARPPHRR